MIRVSFVVEYIALDIPYRELISSCYFLDIDLF